MHLQDGDDVDVKLGTAEQSVSFANTLIRANKNYVTEMHIDTYEANAASIAFHTQGEYVTNETRGAADMLTRKNMQLVSQKSA